MPDPVSVAAPDPAETVVIVGAGFSGTLTAVHLLARETPATRHVLLVERSGRFARGLAYGHDDDNLLLNVPAGNMSALPDAPDHFVDFCRAVDPAFDAGSFVSRRLYGEYLQQLLADAEQAAPGRLTRVTAEVVAVRRTASGFTVALAGGNALRAARVVLALGHSAPRDPLPAPGLAAFGPHAALPWDPAALDALPRTHPVLVLGSGHTAVDALFRLCAGGRRALLVSRRGRLPQPHRALPRAPAPAAFPAWLDPVAPTARAVLHALRAEAARRSAAGGDWRDVLNDLRPHTPALWQRLPLAERRRFLRHAGAFWDVHRHRLAPAAARRLERLLAAGEAECLAARVVALRPLADGVQVTLRRRGSPQTEQHVVGAVVNCTGPDPDWRQHSAPLVRQLLAAGLLAPDPLRLGLLVDTGYRALGADGRPQPGLYVVGPALKAGWWEATAVPELRQHTRALATRLVADAAATQPLAA
jgi:uncharacterized NAD(P)/FAD-binding protein YdhS